MLTIDRYSRSPVVEEMHLPVSIQAVAQKCNVEYMSLFGTSDEIMANNQWHLVVIIVFFL